MFGKKAAERAYTDEKGFPNQSKQDTERRFRGDADVFVRFFGSKGTFLLRLFLTDPLK